MKTPFEIAMAQTLGFEGGASSNANDTAGRGLVAGTVHTYRGITQRLYDAWRRKRGLDAQPVVKVTDEEIVAISREEFWLPCRCDEMPAEVAIALFDMAFHSSPRDAKVALQVSVGTSPDGVIGEKTMAAVRAVDPLDVVLGFLKARGAEMQEIIIHNFSQVQFLEGWIANRLLQVLHNAHRRTHA